METLTYIWEVLCQIFPIALLMGMIAIPILWIWLEENNQYEPLDDYYVTSAKEQIEKYDKKEDISE
jgi:nitrogen fixation-related uncharacterized protein